MNFKNIHTFCSPHHRGNTHCVTLSLGSVQSAKYLNGEMPPDIISVAVTPVHDKKDDKTRRFHIRCHRNQREIEFCGSGLLAAAYCLGQQDPLSQHPILHSASGPIKVKRHGNKLGISRKATPLRPASNSSFWQRILGLAVLEAHTAGGRKGYAIITLQTAELVRKLRLSHHRLKRLTDRALIVTAQGKQPYDFVYRYFAPQYDLPEDIATGSANLILTPYWAKKLGRTQLRSEQLSPAGGGYFVSSYSPPYTSVFGNVVQE